MTQKQGNKEAAKARILEYLTAKADYRNTDQVAKFAGLDSNHQAAALLKSLVKDGKVTKAGAAWDVEWKVVN